MLYSSVMDFSIMIYHFSSPYNNFLIFNMYFKKQRNLLKIYFKKEQRVLQTAIRKQIKARSSGIFL